MFSHPDNRTVSDWIEGKLPEKEAAELERYFEEHPEAAGNCDLDDDILRQLSLTNPEGDLDEVLARVKSGLFCDALAPGDDTWREILSPSNDPDLLGTLGNYEVLEVINTGGMGILFKARDPKLGRIVAIKALSPTLSSVAPARERFLREARAVAKLENEFVLPIHEVDERTVPWFAMRYVEGGTLADRIKVEKKIDADRLAEIGLGIAKALEAAHAEEIQHRDIKPANILLSAEGDQLWVCDFGIARCAEDPSLTYPGAIAGTPRFMSPEQAAGRPLDERSDLFSLGLVLFRCATGEHYYTAETTTGVLAEAAGRARDVSRELARLPEWLRRVILRLLEPDPDDRPGSAAEVVRAIEEKSSPPPRSWGKRKPVRVLFPVFTLFAVLLVGSAAFAYWREMTAPSIRIGDGGPEFTDLAEAVATAPPGSELLLKGNLLLTEYVSVEKPLSLRSASGRKATILVENAGAHGFFFFDPVELKRIRFVRRESVVDSFPILGISHPEGESVVEDCEFLLPDLEETEGSAGFGISVSDISFATIRRCEFRARQGLLLATRVPGAPEARVIVEDSSFTGENAITIRERQFGAPGIDLTIKDCAAEVDTFISQQELGPFPNFKFRIAGSAIFFRMACLSVSKRDETIFADRLRWTGEGNVYGTSGAFVRLFDDDGPASIVAENLEAFTEISGVDETGAKRSDSLDAGHPASGAFSRR